MSINEMEAKIAEMQELDKLAQEAKEAADTIHDESKQIMGDRQELSAGRFIVRWTTTISSRLDTSALKKENSVLYTRYLKQVTSRRFTVSV